MPKNNTGSKPANNSNGATSEVRYKQLSTTAALRAQFSEEPKTYNVFISATHVGKKIDVSNVYDEYHPLMALGRAIMELKRSRGFASIECINIHERIIVQKSNR